MKWHEMGVPYLNLLQIGQIAFSKRWDHQVLKNEIIGLGLNIVSYKGRGWIIALILYWDCLIQKIINVTLENKNSF